MFRGQWTGPYAGSDSGHVIVEIDEVNGQLVGTATVYPSDAKFPPTFAMLTIPLNGPTSFDHKAWLFPIDWGTGDPVPWEKISNRYPGITMSTVADTKWALSGDTLYVSWTTNLGLFGLAVVRRGFPSAISHRTPEPINNWAEFRRYVSTLEPNRYIFRGHSNSGWRLRTSFHRTGRADLRRFINNDIGALHRNLSGLTPHVFDLVSPIQNGAFYTLVQHHGYPTPLLDWTYSPYIAAYFAYRNLPKDQRSDEHRIRIFIFDAEEWRKDFRQLDRFTPALPHFSLFWPLAINNPRLVPQQALLTISNVDDIEGYISEREVERGKTYLRVIDLPGAERKLAMQELSMMGITAGSLFPGLDGACEQVREQFFEL